MPKIHKPRKGSLQYWPRKRARKILPSVNWQFLQKKAAQRGEKTDSEKGEKKFLGLICYKVGMLRVLARDLTPYSMTINREVIVPVTVLECPALKILSIRFYKEGRVAVEALVSTDKELKRRLLLPKKSKKSEEGKEAGKEGKEADVAKKLVELEKNLARYDDLRLIVYPVVRKTLIKKTPDLIEIGLAGELKEKFELAKQWLDKEIAAEEIFSSGSVVDVHGVTKGKGIAGSVKRFGIGLKEHKTEKGVRRPGSLGPWTPKRVSFRAPLAGQLGYFSRVKYNNKIVAIMKPDELNLKHGFHRYGMVKNPCLLIKGSVQGPQKRPLLITVAARPSKRVKKENFEILKVMG